ncbi:unnamed protein product [marine sediment metagenome]|uniref:Uncharacterized protein n=1 Tax=marine sediment metagenome TaxID=412755 RepID=X1BKA3_9ZZZZ
MMKLQYKHITAVTNSIRLLQTCLDDHFQTHIHKQVERDQNDLIELREILRLAHRNPSLPFGDSDQSLAKMTLNQIDQEPNSAL